MIKKVLLAIAVILVILQILPKDKTNPQSNPSEDFFFEQEVDAETKSIIKSACYDCHSHETKFPSYTAFAPIFYWTNHHVEEGRGELNFSTWNTYSVDKQNHKLEESIEETEERHMPLKSYTWTHGDAKLSDAQIEKITAYFKSRIK